MPSAIDRARARRRVQSLKRRPEPHPSPAAEPRTGATPVDRWRAPLWARLAYRFLEPFIRLKLKDVLSALKAEVHEMADLTDNERALLEEAVPVIAARLLRETRERMS